MKAKEIFAKIKAEQNEAISSLSLIPSENLLSKKAIEMFSLRNYNKYILPLKFRDKTYMPGRERLEEIVNITKEKLCSQYGMKYVLLESLSGLNLMDIILSSMRFMFKNLILLDPFSGGHSSSAELAKKYKYKYNFIDIVENNFDIDYVELDKYIKNIGDEKTLIYLDHTVVLKPIDIKKLIKKIPQTWAVYYDISHLQLFYFTHIYQFPKSKNFFFGGSTHKSFPGPQKAIALFNNKALYQLVKKEIYFSLSSIHIGDIFALLITIMEMEKFGKQYARGILKKSQLFAKTLNECLNVIGPTPDLTYTHQVCVEVEDEKKVTRDLARIGIITTPMRIPIIKKKGLRLGLQELCRLGITDNEVKTLSKIIIKCILNGPSNILKKEIKRIAMRHQKIKYGL